MIFKTLASLIISLAVSQQNEANDLLKQIQDINGFVKSDLIWNVYNKFLNEKYAPTRTQNSTDYAWFHKVSKHWVYAIGEMSKNRPRSFTNEDNRNQFVKQVLAELQDDDGLYDDQECKSGKCNVLLNMDLISNYGCWCNKDTFGTGIGSPKDEYDALCKTLSQCTQCLSHDSRNRCTLDVRKLRNVFNWEPRRGVFNGSCGKAHKDKQFCEKNYCLCLNKFMNSLIRLALNGVPINTKLIHGRGFDPQTDCVHTNVHKPKSRGSSNNNNDDSSKDNIFGGNAKEFTEKSFNKEILLQQEDPEDLFQDFARMGQSGLEDEGVDIECCGRFPNRVPYNTAYGLECCNVDGKLFDPVMKSCCRRGIADSCF